jgi:hypothetical protein
VDIARPYPAQLREIQDKGVYEVRPQELDSRGQYVRELNGDVRRELP